METRLHIVAHSGMAIALVATLALLGLAVYIWHIRAVLEKRDQLVLSGLRLCAVAGLIAAFMQPSVRYEEVVRRASTVLVLVDESASMGALAAGGKSRAEEVSAFFAGHKDFFEGLERDHDVRYFAFSDRARPVTREAIEAGLAPTGGSTSVVSAIRQAMGGMEPSAIGGIIIVTDGFDNGNMPVDSGLPGPMYALITSPPDAPRDIAIASVQGLGYLVDRNLAEVRCELHAVGLGETAPDGRLTVTLSDGATTLDRAEVDVADVAKGTTVTLSFLPRGPGRRVLQVAVSSVPGEVTTLNNVRREVVDVVRDRLRCLHVAGHPSWDERFLREYLRHRRDVELISFHTLRPPDAVIESSDDETTLIPFPAEDVFVKEVEGFDIIILQDFELPEVDRERYAASIIAYVQNGGALLMVGGSYTFGARGPWPVFLDPVLPVVGPRTPVRGMREGRVVVFMPPEAAQHPLFADQQLAFLLRRAPPLLSANLSQGPKPGATVLLRGGAEPSGSIPLLITGVVGLGRTAVILTDSLWRWAFDPTFKELYRLVLDRLMAHLTFDPSASPVRVTASRPRLTPGQEQVISVSMAQGCSHVSVVVERMNEGGIFQPVLGPVEARDTIRFVVDRPGIFRVRASGVMGDAQVSADDLFLADVAPLEAGKVFGAPSGVIGALTGGKVIPLGAADLSTIYLRPEVRATVSTYMDEPIWNHPIFFLVMTLLLGVEWYIERKTGYT